MSVHRSKLGLWDYVKAAFSAKPIGMLVPPNWIGLAAFALLGLVNPGFLLLGAGLELAYLYTISSNDRFRRVVDSGIDATSHRQWAKRQTSLLKRIFPEDRIRFRNLERRCQGILEGQAWTDAGPELKAQGVGLGRLLWIFLRLLLTRQTLRKVLPDFVPPELRGKSLTGRIEELDERLAADSLDPDLRKSLTGQVDILRQRMEKREEARQKMQFIEAELVRIEEQVELIREQAVVAASPEVVAQRIDDISATLGGTTQWISEQQELIGEVEDLLVEPHPLVVPDRAEESE